MSSTERFQSFREFYPFYLAEHKNPVCRSLHYVGSILALAISIFAVVTANYLYILGAPLLGYALAWTGHFFFEHNKPATFQYPVWSLMGDWVMLKDFLGGKFRKSVTD